MTFLIDEDQLYNKGYKIFRADGQTRRKGVVVLVRTELEVETVRVIKDRDGRFVNLRIWNRTSGISRTFSSMLLLSKRLLHESMISKLAMGSDYIGGNLNNSDSILNREGVYHLRNIKVVKTFQVPMQVSEN